MSKADEARRKSGPRGRASVILREQRDEQRKVNDELRAAITALRLAALEREPGNRLRAVGVARWRRACR